ncbi:hypothetical protein [Legionella sp. WA2024007413]
MRKLLTALLLTVTTVSLTDNVIITIDEKAHTYTTVERTSVPEGDYYTYHGYRFHAGIPSGSDIYC